MLAFLGHWLVLLAMGAAVLNIGATTLAYRRSNREAWLEAGHNAALVMWAFIMGAAALLIAAFVTNDFSLAFVYENSSRAQTLPFKISAMWGGQGGSLLLWTIILASYTLAVSVGGRRSGQMLSPAATSTLCGITIFFAYLVAFVASPFALIQGAVPQDGHGMTPLLQNYWMQIHPPTLYMGFVGCSVPFAFAVSALMHRRFDEEWVAVVRRWVLFTWIWLTVGIILGGVWAYETLGWGGYWAWDPVENASLIPWLSATAFLHSIMLQGRRGLLKNWNIALVTLTFLLSVFGTYLNRSGVVASVHAFAANGNNIGNYFLAFLGFALLATLALILWRRSELHSDATIDSPWSREGVFMLNNWLLLGATFAVLWGTVFPTFSGALTNQRVVVEAPYFNRVMIPIGLCLLFLTGVGPLLPWRRATPLTVWKAIKLPLLWALAFSPVLYLLAQWRTGAATAFTLALFVAISIGWEFVRGIRTLMVKRRETVLESAANLVTFNPARYGGYIVHLGIAMMFVGITGSSVFKIETVPITLKKGETMRLGEYTLRFDGLARPNPIPVHLNDQMVALVSVFDGPAGTNQVTKPERPLDPHMDYFKDNTKSAQQQNMNEPVKRPCILSSPANDIYLTLVGFDTKDNSASIKAYLNPLVMWIWVSVAFFIGGTLIALLPTRRNKGMGTPQVPAVAREAAPQRERELVA